MPENKYSVLMTVYGKDNPEYFDLSLGSMVCQTIKPAEIVLVLDGPVSDGLRAVIKKYEQQEPGLLHILPLPQNVGLGKALQQGMLACRCELVARMDSDDISLPERCELQLQAFRRQPDLDIVGFSVTEFSGSPENIVGSRMVPETNEEIYKFAHLRDPFNHPTVMFRKSSVLSAGNYGDYRKNQDSDLWVRMLSRGAKCRNLPGKHFLFRFDEGTAIKRKSWLNTWSLIEIRWQGWRLGYNSLSDLLLIVSGQLMRFVLPVSFQKKLYDFIFKKFQRV